MVVIWMEMHDEIVQKLTAARWNLDIGRMDTAHEQVEEALACTQRLVTRILQVTGALEEARETMRVTDVEEYGSASSTDC